MNAPQLRRVLLGYLALLVPAAWLAGRYEHYIIDGDAVAYMDIADLLHAHHWAGAVNGYWHPLYPAMLWLAQVLFHPTRLDEVGAYIGINVFIFFLQVAAMLAFTTALIRLRERTGGAAAALLSPNAVRLLGVGLLLISLQRELSPGRVRPDALLQALILAGLAMLLLTLASGRLRYAPPVGIFFGLAYLAKSFAFVFALLSIILMVLFLWIFLKHSLRRAAVCGALALVAFLAIAGPYVAALSHQKHRFDFGDSGSLNYAWYVGGTEKMHLEPWMTSSFGSAKVHLLHPEQQLLAQPGVYSYKALAYGTYPPWFDTTFFNERIIPHMTLRGLAVRDERNLILVFRYIGNHPEPIILMVLMLCAGATLRSQWSTWFWLPPVALGIALWIIYGMVNVEERYVTVGYLAVLLPLFAALGVPRPEAARRGWFPHLSAEAARIAAASLVVLLAFLTLGETFRLSAEARRNALVAGLPSTWYNPQIYGAAHALPALGVHPGDEIACVGTTACLYDNYWARLAGVRVLTEVYEPDPNHLIQQLQATPNLAQVYATVRGQGARVLVGYFDSGAMNSAIPAAAGWQRLGQTNFYALPLLTQNAGTEARP